MAKSPCHTHHPICLVVDDVDAAEADAAKRGLKAWMRGRRKNGSGFTYFDTVGEGAGVTLSIRKSPPVT